MSEAQKALEAARAAGITVRLDGGRLLMKSEGKAPEELIAALKARREEIRAWLEAEDRQDEILEREAVIEIDGKVPRLSAQALARLDPSSPPGDVPINRWHLFIDDAGIFLDAWGNQIEALGWSQLQLFGCCPARPYARIS